MTIAGGGDRRAYQQDPRNGREALAEIEQDLAEGADMIMVKPAMTSLDVLATVAPRRLGAPGRLPRERRVLHGARPPPPRAGSTGRRWRSSSSPSSSAPAPTSSSPTSPQRWPRRSVAEPAPATASNAAWFERARRVIPGGVDSPVRSFASVGGTPYTVVSGEGAFVRDVEGNRYLDMVQSYGAVLLGHAHPVVTGAVTAAAAKGTTFGAPTPGEVLLAEAICARVPGCEQVRLVSSGTEAAMSAVRLARGATGRDRVIKFDGCYHGHSDGLLARRGQRRGHARPPRLGRRVRRRGRRHRGRPLQRGARPRRAGRLRDRRAGGGQHESGGAGARVPRGAARRVQRQRCAPRSSTRSSPASGSAPAGATGWSGVTPDLWCFGKVIGGGLPVGAFGGRRDLMAELAPGGPVYQAGTLSGNPLATAAGLARCSTRWARPTTRRWPHACRGVRQGPRVGGGRRWPGGRRADRGAAGRPLRGAGRRRTHRGADRLRRRRGAIATGDTYARFFHAMLRRGVGAGAGRLRGDVPRSGPRRGRAGPRWSRRRGRRRPKSAE